MACPLPLRDRGLPPPKGCGPLCWTPFFHCAARKKCSRMYVVVRSVKSVSRAYARVQGTTPSALLGPRADKRDATTRITHLTNHPSVQWVGMFDAENTMRRPGIFESACRTSTTLFCLRSLRKYTSCHPCPAVCISLCRFPACSIHDM